MEGPLPSLDFKKELAVQKLCREAIQKGLLHSTHDVSEGGLAVCLAESCFLPNGQILGASIKIEAEGGACIESLLFGEGPSQIVVSLSPQSETKFLELTKSCASPVKLIGRVGGNRLIINDWVNLGIDEIKEKYEVSF